ncbi:MAG: TetR/AcrR family transcriptional regulator [Betaproteobacteria bacterium]|jgi:TetR/AcrR family transcriptional repressor of nem operon|nr:TetR/AcrR family transcriptional regulator [Betaproteobacteria bacterium]NBY17315.1 TetR/AcrR family transcriptional regulator [Betaproteobacteria bacterium]
MGRPVEFDRPTAVNRALALFWRQGYQATSLADLLPAMGISRSSFYAAFGDKRGFFIECLDLWAARTLQLLNDQRNGLPPIDALQKFFERSVAEALGPKVNWGCMLVNTVLEMSGVDDELATRASTHMADMERIFQDSLQDAGATPAQAEKMAAMLMLFNEGIRVSSRRRLPEAQQLQSISTTFGLVRSALA